MTPLPAGLQALQSTIAARLAGDGHGDLPRWLAAIAALPALLPDAIEHGPWVTASGTISEAQRGTLSAALSGLRPWRKGPFRLFGVHIDAEWRSDWKWQRVATHLPDLHGRRVLDVGCGNGYFGWRMLEAGATEVVGVDPSPLYCLQHRAIQRYLDDPRNHVLPLRFEELPALEFDAVFSMGVVYHRRDPAEHVRQLLRHTAPGGHVVLETLIVESAEPLRPANRYARMRNVWTLPTPMLLEGWMTDAGLDDVRVVDVTTTSTDEQRTTAWMPFESLAEALDPDDPTRTVEGHPAPVRAIAIGRKPVYSTA